MAVGRLSDGSCPRVTDVNFFVSSSGRQEGTVRFQRNALNSLSTIGHPGLRLKEFYQHNFMNDMQMLFYTGEFLLFVNLPEGGSIARRCGEQEIGHWVEWNSFYATLVVSAQRAL